LLKKAKLENSELFPEHFVKAITHVRVKDNYDFSVTEIVRPLQMIYLQRTNDYEIDALNGIKALMGTAFHAYMETQKVKNPDDYVMEKRVFKTIEGITISGQPDLYHKSARTLWDYKTTGMYRANMVLKGDILKTEREWVIQTNCYRYMAELDCNKIKILAVVTDFRKNNNYGLDKPVIIIDLPTINNDSMEKWLIKRVKKIKETMDVGKYPECSEEETWGGKRCKDWCDVSSFCKQYRKTVKQGFDYE